MDLERIKQNFRIRSGRSKQKKKPKSTALTQQTPNSGIKEPAPTKGSPETQPEDEHSRAQPDQDESQQGQGINIEDSKSQDQERNGSEGLDEPFPSSGDSGDVKPDATNGQGTQGEEPDHDLDLSQSKSEEAMSKPQGTMEPGSEVEDFDLNPPKPRSKPPSLETLSELLFSSGHLDSLLHHPPQLSRFAAFMQKYIPDHYPLLAQYLETQKAIKAVAYANAIAEGLQPHDTGRGSTTETRQQAANLDSAFEEISQASFKALVGEILPSYISYSLVKTVSDCLTNEITGRSTPVMRELVGGLSEVFCLTDPNQQDNPIIYASEEFYRLTRYGPEDVLNNNCRFLQGRKTNPDSPKRLKNAIQNGEEISETLLNYRRDGRPFMNLLMVAPLHDRNGKLKYHIGAQVDVTGLVQGGRAMEGFQRYLNRRAEDQHREEQENSRKDLSHDQQRKRRVLASLRDLSETFDLEESAVVQANSRSNSLSREDDDNRSIGSAEKPHRRVYVDSEASDVEDEDLPQQQDNVETWKLGEAGDGRLSGKLPGVYDSFLLLRPAPSLRIVFVSPKLRRIGNVLQTPFLSHVAAPSATLSGLAESLKTGVPVSAKIHFTPERGENRDGNILRNGTKHEDGKNGRAIWVSCTPLLGDDERIGVWMCVVVEKSKVGSGRKTQDVPGLVSAEVPVRSIEQQKNKSESSPKAQDSKPASLPTSPSINANPAPSQDTETQHEDMPIKPIPVDDQTVIIQAEQDLVEESLSPDQTRSAKSIRPMQSIYFDAVDGQEPMISDDDQHTPTGQQHSTERTNPGLRPQDANDETRGRSPRAVLTPVEEYNEPDDDADDHSTQVPSTSSLDVDQAGEEYVDTQLNITSSSQNGRVVIEEDSDVLPEDEPNNERRPMDSEQPHQDQELDRTPHSPPSDISPAMPSSSHSPHREEDDSLDQKKTPTPDGDTLLSSAKPDAEPEYPEDTDHNEQLADSQATLRDLSSQRTHDDKDRDSAISVNTPEHAKTMSSTLSPPVSPSHVSHEEAASLGGDGYAKDDDEQDAAKHKHDIKNWVEDARPPSSKQHVNPNVEMDYMRASTTRWSRPPRLGMNVLDEANQHWTMRPDHCVTSPNSVD